MVGKVHKDESHTVLAFEGICVCVFMCACVRAHVRVRVRARVRACTYGVGVVWKLAAWKLAADVLQCANARTG